MYTRIAIAAVIALTLAGTHWRAYTRGQQVVQVRWDAERGQAALQAEIRREDNRARTRGAEVQQAAQTIYRDRYITQTITEIRHATDPLAVCPVPPDAVRMLNDAARCAGADRPAACGADDAVPGAR